MRYKILNYKKIQELKKNYKEMLKILRIKNIKKILKIEYKKEKLIAKIKKNKIM